MTRNTVVLERSGLGHLATGAIGADGLAAISAIPGVEDARVERETEHQVEISYAWIGAARFWTTQEHLAQFGLQRMYHHE